MLELGRDEVAHGGLDGVGRSRQGKDERIAVRTILIDDDPRQGAGEDRGGFHLLEAEEPKQLAEARQFIGEQGANDVDGQVASGNSRPAGGDDHIYIGICNPFGELPVDVIRLILDDHLSNDGMTGLLDMTGNQRSSGIGLDGAGVGNGEDRA